MNMLKYSKKKKFVDRGMYAVLDGVYKGGFVFHIKERSTDTKKAMFIIPDMIIVMMDNSEVSDLFEKKYFEYYTTVPKGYYKVLLAEYDLRSKL